MRRLGLLSMLSILTVSAFTGPPCGAQETAEAAAPGPMDMFIAYSRGQLQAQGFERRVAETGGEDLVWWQKGEGPTLVLVHGVSDQAGTWFLVAGGLAADHRVLLVDLPGHGESGPAKGPLAMDRIADGFEAWLATHAAPPSGQPPVLVGNSMGAWVVLLAALRSPDHVSRVVAVNGGGLHADTGDLDLLPKTREEARRLMAALRDPASPPTLDAVLDDLVRRVPTGQVSRMFEAEGSMEALLLDDRLGQIDTPVDVLWGASDRYLGRAYAERLAEGLPNARLTFLETCGHLPQAECPKSFTEGLRAVLAQDPPSTPNEPPTKETPP